FGNELSGVGVDRVSHLRHMALLHQDLDDVDTALRHAVRELLDGDGLRDRDFALQLFLVLIVAMTGHALRAPAERCDRTFAHLVGGQRGHEGEAAALLRCTAARRFRSRRRNAGRAHTAARRAAIIIVGLRRNDARAFCTCGFFLAKALLRNFVSLALGFLVVTPALLLGALARLGGLAL